MGKHQKDGENLYLQSAPVLTLLCARHFLYVVPLPELSWTGDQGRAGAALNRAGSGGALPRHKGLGKTEGGDAPDPDAQRWLGPLLPRAAPPPPSEEPPRDRSCPHLPDSTPGSLPPPARPHPHHLNEVPQLTPPNSPMINFQRIRTRTAI